MSQGTFGTLVRKDDDDEDEEINEDGVPWFYVNSSGFPIDDSTWERMWDYVSKIHPEGRDMVDSIRNKQHLEEHSIPQAPTSFPAFIPVDERLRVIQSYMSELQYPLLYSSRHL